jgi:hypothetical protein
VGNTRRTWAVNFYHLNKKSKSHLETLLGLTVDVARQQLSLVHRMVLSTKLSWQGKLEEYKAIQIKWLRQHYSSILCRYGMVWLRPYAKPSKKQQLCLNLLFDIYLSGFESFKTIFQSFMDLSDPTDSLIPHCRFCRLNSTVSLPWTSRVEAWKCNKTLWQ